MLLKGSFIAYMVPVLLMMAGALGAGWLSPLQGDLSAAVGSVAGLALGFLLVRWHARHHVEDPYFQPVLLEVLSAPVASVQLV